MYKFKISTQSLNYLKCQKSTKNKQLVNAKSRTKEDSDKKGAESLTENFIL